MKTLNQNIVTFVANEFAASPHKLLDVSVVAELFRVSKKRVLAALDLDPAFSAQVRIAKDGTIAFCSKNDAERHYLVGMTEKAHGISDIRPGR
jgi:hypothetical protein